MDQPHTQAVASPDADGRLRRAERAENFPVALRVLPARLRVHLRAVYDTVRVIDDLGDESGGDRVSQLEDFATDLARVWSGSGGEPASRRIDTGPRSPVLVRLVPTVRACGLPRAPLDRLVEANLQDQRVTRYDTWTDLLDYCALSAAPVGRLVLAVFGVDAPPGSALVRGSDRVCTALQLLEHWQDVAEDRRRGRTYLPAQDLAAFGVPDTDLDAPTASPALRALLAHETARAVALLDSGAGVVRRLPGWARLAVAGYVAGGRAAAAALHRADFDVLRGPPPARRRDVTRHLVTELIRSVR